MDFKMKKTKLGVIGCGMISGAYLKAASRFRNIEIVAGSDIVPGRAAAKRDEFKEFGYSEETFRAYDANPDGTNAELLSDPEIEVVLNLTPPKQHSRVDLEILNAGKHAYSEKPFGVDADDAAKVVALAQKKGLRVGCAPDTFLGGRLQNIRELLDSGKLGRITGGGAWFVGHGHEFHHPAPAFFYQPGAGPLYDMGPYYMTALLSLLGPVKRVCAMATKAGETRTVPSGPSKGQVLPVDVDTHINAILEFVCGAQVTLTCSFDVWDSELPRMELYGTKGTVLINEKDPISGPNLFGGETLMRTPEQYRWADPERRPENVNTPWPVVPHSHPFNSVSHAENPRGIGLIDMVQALHEGRTPRASGDMALHSLEVMECILKSAHEHVFCEPTTSFAQPAPLPSDTAER